MGRGRKTEEPKIIFTNQPNMEYIWQVLLDLIAQQEGGEYEYTVKLTPKASVTSTEAEQN